MIRNLAILLEINALWGPVYPFMAGHLLDRGPPAPATALDLGPFAGGIGGALLAARPDLRVTVLDLAPEVLSAARTDATAIGAGTRLVTVEAPLAPLPFADGSFDLVAVRGAFFFLTSKILGEVGRVLAPGGFAWVGGGYGPTTPDEVIAPIADRSRQLNAAIGKRRVSAEEAALMVFDAGLHCRAGVVEVGGLWIEVRG